MKKYNSPEIEWIVLRSSECMNLDSTDYEQNKDEVDFDEFFGNGNG